MRKKIVAGNWKMNNTLNETDVLLEELLPFEPKAGVSVMVAPSFVCLPAAVAKTRNSNISIVAQNAHQYANGAYTGEVSVPMLQSIGIQNVILGHSERRAYFGESDELLAQKTKMALSYGFTVIFCVGEELKHRNSETHFRVVEQQLREGLFSLDKEAWKQIVIAYEPVWAIGTGETASPEQAQEMHAFIRKTIALTYGYETAENVSILYGGSVKPDNAREIFAKSDVDGGLIGGASLKASDFLKIVDSF